MCPAQACLGQASPRKAWPAEAGFQGGEPADKDDCTYITMTEAPRGAACGLMHDPSAQLKTH